MNRVRTLTLGAVAALLLAAGALLLTGGADAHSASVVVSPRQGAPRTHFVVSFWARRVPGYRGGTLDRYEVKASGPSGKGCASSVLVTSAPANHVSVTLSPPTGLHVWCPGSYRGTVSATVRPSCSPGEICPQFILLVTVGRFGFRVN